jgi:hypothetical protein
LIRPENFEREFDIGPVSAVTKKDFSDLKKIAREIAGVQKRNERRMEELAEAQKNTKIAGATLAKGLEATRSELNSLARNIGYSLGNGAYR